MNLIFTLRQCSELHIHCGTFADPLLLPRDERQQVLQSVIDHCVARLGHYALQSPLDWFNLFDFWQLSEIQDKEQRVLNDPRLTAEVELTTPFHDVGVIGVAWHGDYFRYFEVTREALLNQFSYSCRQMKESGYLQPVVDARVRYRHALTLEQRIHVHAHIEEFENRLRASYRISNVETGKRATTGYIVQVAVEKQDRELCFVSPDALFERMGVKP